MQFKSIQYFMEVARLGSFTAAAEALFISQPALSQQIKKLEDEVGAQLFDRSRHTAELTEAGTLFLQEGKRILQIYDQVLRHIAAMENPIADVVRFGISPFYSRYYLPRLLPPLVAAHPALKYEVTEDYSYVIESAVIEGKLDFCLVPLEPKNPLLSYETIYQESILLAVPRDSLVNEFAVPANGIPYLDLKYAARENFIALKSVQKFSDFGRELCRQAGFEPNVVCELMNWDTLNMLVSTGLGVGFVPDLLIGQMEEERRPRYYRLLSDARRAYTIARRKEETPPASVRMVIESFRSTFQNLEQARF